MPPSTTPHMPAMARRSSAIITWHVDVPMIATIWPDSTARAAGAVTWASTLPTETAMPAGSPVRAAASGVSRPASPPSGATGPSSLSTAKRPKSGATAARYASVG